LKSLLNFKDPVEIPIDFFTRSVLKERHRGGGLQRWAAAHPAAAAVAAVAAPRALRTLFPHALGAGELEGCATTDDSNPDDAGGAGSGSRRGVLSALLSSAPVTAAVGAVGAAAGSANQWLLVDGHLSATAAELLGPLVSGLPLLLRNGEYLRLVPPPAVPRVMPPPSTLPDYTVAAGELSSPELTPGLNRDT
jgi:hypothetical protein